MKLSLVASLLLVTVMFFSSSQSYPLATRTSLNSLKGSELLERDDNCNYCGDICMGVTPFNSDESIVESCSECYQKQESCNSRRN